MAKVTEIIPQGTTLRFIQVDDTVYVLLPLGNTVFTNPTSPTNDGNWVTTYSQEMEIVYDDENEVKDLSSPAVGFCEYIGGRPRSR
jgi:hypothetical protein